MRQIILNVEESKFETLLSFIKTLDYISVSSEELIPEWQQKEVEKRMELVEKGSMQTQRWDEAKREIFSR